MRRSKQIKIEDIEDLSAKYGTIDKNSPDVLYIRAKGRIMPTIKKNDYSKDIVELKNSFTNIVKDNISFFRKDINTEKYICNIDVSEKGISYKRGSYIKYDIFIKPNEKRNIVEYKNIVTSFLVNVNDNVKEKLKNLNLEYTAKIRPKK